jgi:hypothetical protein
VFFEIKEMTKTSPTICVFQVKYTTNSVIFHLHKLLKENLKLLQKKPIIIGELLLKITIPPPLKFYSKWQSTAKCNIGDRSNIFFRNYY